MKHVTVTNIPTNQVFQCMKNVINLGERFPSVQIGHGKGFGYKIILFRMFLDECCDDEIVMFTDAHDVHVSGTHDDILESYRMFGSDIVFAAERNCWPVKSLETQYQTHTDSYIKYKYLNSGCFIGRVDSLKKFMDQNFHNVSGASDDQMWYTQLYLKNQTDRKLVRLDVRCEIFQCLHLAMYDIDENTLTNKVTGTRPLVWHSNGSLLEFFMTKLCKQSWTPPVMISIDQQLISPEKNVICLTSQTCVNVKFYKTRILSKGESVRQVQDEIHQKYPYHWILILGENVRLPDQFEYRIYGRVLDTRKMYVLLKPDGTMESFQLYFDKTKKYAPDEWSMMDQFMRAGYIDAL